MVGKTFAYKSNDSVEVKKVFQIEFHFVVTHNGSLVDSFQK